MIWWQHDKYIGRFGISVQILHSRCLVITRDMECMTSFNPAISSVTCMDDSGVEFNEDIIHYNYFTLHYEIPTKKTEAAACTITELTGFGGLSRAYIYI